MNRTSRAPTEAVVEGHDPVTREAFGGHPRALVEEALERLLASAVFRRSERHRRLMRHIVGAALDGRGDRLKEVVLGLELFGRSLDRYDTRSDPIVRVEVGRIRDKLARYYDGDGVNDAFAFAIPIGSYVPSFQRRARSATAARRVESFAVMPFTAGTREDEVNLSIGLTDELIHLLGRLRDVKVVARVSAFKARERDLDAKATGRLLGVTRLIDGSVQRHGERTRCVVHIVRTRDGTTLWSQSFDTDLHGRDSGGAVDLFAFQDHITKTVLAAIAPANDAAAPAGPGAAPLASDAPVRSRRTARDLLDHAAYLSRLYATDQTGKVLALLEDAVALDPGSARAQVALATTYLHQATQSLAPTATVLPKVRFALDRAVVLDPDDAEALALRAQIAFRFDFDWARAERLFIDALRVAPHASGVHYRYAFGLIFNGRFAEGMRHARAAVDLDPLNLGMRAMAAQLLGYARRHDEAIAEAHAVLHLEPAHVYMNFVLGQIHLHLGDPEAALARFDTSIASHPDHPSAPIGRICAFGLAGQIERGRQALHEYRIRHDERYSPSYGLAMAHVCLGDRPATYAALERAAREGDTSFCTLPVDPLFVPLHDDPTFTDLLARYGLRPALR